MADTAFSDPVLALARPETLVDPYPHYAALRQHSPVFFYEPLNSWFFTTHADCVTVLRDSTTFAADWRRVGETVPPRAINMLTLDPPEHTGVRRLFLEVLRAQDNRLLEAQVTKRVTVLLDTLARRESFDFNTELAEPLALATTADYLGVEAPDVAWTSRIGRIVAAGMDAGLFPERGAHLRDAHEELATLVDGWLADPPDHGILGALAPHLATAEVTADVLANTVRGLLFSGFSSGGKLLTSAAVTVLHEAATTLGDLAAADAVRATDELVRYAGPIQAVARACITDTVVGDTRVKAGDAVTLLLGAANRDPLRFDEPETVRLDRHPNPHLGFGRGPKSCLGSPFTALLLRVTMRELARRFPHARALREPSYLTNLTLRSPDRFPVTLRFDLQEDRHG